MSYLDDMKSETFVRMSMQKVLVDSAFKKLEESNFEFRTVISDPIHMSRHSIVTVLIKKECHLTMDDINSLAIIIQNTFVGASSCKLRYDTDDDSDYTILVKDLLKFLRCYSDEDHYTEEQIEFMRSLVYFQVPLDF